MNRYYQSRLIKKLGELQADLNSEKISQEEFNILLGLLLKMEMNDFVKSQVKEMNLEEDKKMTFISYARTNRLHTI